MRILPLFVYCILFLLVSPWALHIVFLFLFVFCVFFLKKKQQQQTTNNKQQTTTNNQQQQQCGAKSEVTKVDHGGVTIYLCIYIYIYMYEYIL